MENKNGLEFVKKVVENCPNDWLKLTTHRLDIYDESQAKTDFIAQFEKLVETNNFSTEALNNLPTAFDYIRLGHPLSCILEWSIANANDMLSENVISFSSSTMPVQAILRKNLLANKKTIIAYRNELPSVFNTKVLKSVYGYSFELEKVENYNSITDTGASVVYVAEEGELAGFDFGQIKNSGKVDFLVNQYGDIGSVVLVFGGENEDFVSEIQHVRRRETIAMTPSNCLVALQELTGANCEKKDFSTAQNKASVRAAVKKITGTNTEAHVGSSGLSVQYAIMMGLVDDALQNCAGKDIKFIVPPNCYGGTNDQARRVAACNDKVEILDLPVDGDNDMVRSIDRVLDEVAKQDATPYIIVEIPTNPTVEVPDLNELRSVLEKERKTANGSAAIDPVFILDQTFCPNVHFLGEGEILSSIRAISYVSGSKFPSGGKCTAGYCVANDKAASLMDKIGLHLELCDNEATALQYEFLAEQLPSMIERIAGAYKNTREFVNFIEETLPDAKINFVSEELAEQGFTPSVFSLDLPTKGTSPEEKEEYKRLLNHKLINLMITEIPNESKYCVSYGQLKGCYWTIPATSTQGTTKESDKDYIARVALAPDLDLEKHKQVFADFVGQMDNWKPSS